MNCPNVNLTKYITIAKDVACTLFTCVLIFAGFALAAVVFSLQGGYGVF